MGIEKIDPRTQAIINALKDGRINEKEFDALNKEFGLTKKEAEELNKAFSSGKATIGDYVLVNMGQKDGKQFSQVVEAEKENPVVQFLKENPVTEFFSRRLTRAYDGLVKPFVDAFNKNNGAADVAKAEVAAAGEAAVNFVKLAAVGEVEHLEMLGKAVFSPFSCSSDDFGDTNINNQLNQEVTVNATSSLEDTVKALIEGQNVTNELLKQIIANQIKQGADLSELVALCKGYEEILNRLVDLMVENNVLLQDIKKENGDNAEKLLKAIQEVKASVDGLKVMIKGLPDDMRAEFEPDLTAIYNAIKEGNVHLADIKANLKSLAEKLLPKLEQIYKQDQANGKTLEEIRDMLEKIKYGQEQDYTQILLNMLDVLKNIDFTTQDTNQTVKEIQQQIAAMQEQLATVVTDVSSINKKVTAIAKTEEEQKALLEQILAAIKALRSTNSKENQEILEALLKQGNKLDDIMAVLNAINSNVVAGNKTSENYGKQILAAIKAGNVSLESIRKLVEHIDGDMHKVLKNQDVIIENQGTITANQEIAMKFGNTVFEWLKKNKPQGGSGADYTAILNNMYAKLDEILAAIKDHDVHVTVDDINVTVDVTGKVKCECTCSDGHKHEGIIGDLGIV